MTRDQQKRLNAMCGDLEKQVRLNLEGRYIHRTKLKGGDLGRVLDKDSWRWMFCGTYKGNKFVPAIEGYGFILLGGSSRDLSVEDASNVIEMLFAFGGERDVEWTDPDEQSALNAYELESRQ